MSSSLEHLVYMANQIAAFFETQPGQAQAEGVADHIRAFWEPRMRRDIIAHQHAGGEGLSPLASEAVRMLQAPAAAVEGALIAEGKPLATAEGDDAG